MLRLRAAALAVCLVATPAAAQLYRWTDGEGTVHYTADLDAIPPAHRAAAQLLSAPQPRPAPPPGPEPTVLRAGSGAPITVAARLNGIALTLVVDTGADRTVLSPSSSTRYRPPAASRRSTASSAETPSTRSPSPSTRPRAARRSRRDDERNLGDAIVTRFRKRLSGVRHQVL